MSEYWVSKKKYFCKYCDIYIADDAPSRQQHENGLRHKGSVERFIRGIYKQGEKLKKDKEEEAREMKRVEQLAAAAFAEDVGSGRAKASAAPVASSSSTPAARKPYQKPSDPYANYTTAASLGYTDPDAERLAAEAEIRRSQGVVGDWAIVTPPPTSAPHDSTPANDDPNATTDATGSMKREAEAPPDDDDVRAFKLRKKTLQAGLGEIYDPGVIPIKLKAKKKEEDSASPIPPKPEQNEPPPPLKWTKISLTKQSASESGEGSVKTEDKAEDAIPSSSTSGSKWAKPQWAEKPLEDTGASPSIFGTQSDEASTSIKKEDEAAAGEVKLEEGATGPLTSDTTPTPPSGLFKKRKAPAGAGRGRKPV